MANTIEDQLQAQCFQWFHNTYPHLRQMLFAVPNGGLRDKITANKLKATGVVAGVSDLIFIVEFEVHFIELKTPTGTQSDDQISFQQKVNARGHRYYIIRSFEQFKELICSIIGR